jgi:hypothetical protein
MASISKGCRLPDGPVHLLIDSTGLTVYGTGEWLQEKHGVRVRRTWRKLHLAVDAEIGSVTADGAYDGAPTYDTNAARGRHSSHYSTACDCGTERHL